MAENVFNCWPGPSAERCRGFLLHQFWRILPGIFLEHFSGHFFPQKGGEQIRRQNTRKKSGGPKIKNPRKIRSAITLNPFNCNGSPYDFNCRGSRGAPKKWPNKRTPARASNPLDHLKIVISCALQRAMSLKRMVNGLLHKGVPKRVCN